jgi:hypothetical protein
MLSEDFILSFKTKTEIRRTLPNLDHLAYSNKMDVKLVKGI